MGGALFEEATGDPDSWRARSFAPGDIREEFNTATEVEPQDDQGDEDDERSRSWKQRAEDKRQQGHKPKQGRSRERER